MILEPSTVIACVSASTTISGTKTPGSGVQIQNGAGDVLCIIDASDTEAWRAAAWRLKGLAASFGAMPLMTLARAAADTPPGDDDMLRRLRDAVEQL